MAQGLLLVISVGGALAFAIQVARWPDHPLADMTHVTGWARNIQRDGIEEAYSGVYPESYLIYPPGMAYAYRAAVQLSEGVPPPPGVQPGDWLRLSIKLVAVAGHGALALALFGIVAVAGGRPGGPPLERHRGPPDVSLEQAVAGGRPGGHPLKQPGRTLSARGAFWPAWFAATLYAWNPAALFDAAYWGQGDSLNTTLLVLALGALMVFPGWWPLREGDRWRLGAQAGAVASGAVAGALLATGSLVKPQTWVFLPLVIWIAWRRTGPLGLVATAGAGAAMAWWIVQPWARAGRLADMLSVFVNLPQVMPSVSANAHNLWWLKLPGVAIAVLDWQPVGGFGEWAAPALLTHATVGRLGFGLFALIALLRLTGRISPQLILAAAGYTASAYFMTITQVHENHQFAALPFLAATAALDPWFLLPFATTTLCSFLNMALHDFLIGDAVSGALGWWLPWHEPLALQTANAALNVAGFAVFTVLLLCRPLGEARGWRAGAASPSTAAPEHGARLAPAAARDALSASRALLWRARLVLGAGLALAGGALGALLALLRQPLLAGRLWERLADSARRAGPIEAKLGHNTPTDDLLARAAVDFANLLYTLAGVAAISGTLAAVAGLWWIAMSVDVKRQRPPRATPLSSTRGPAGLRRR